ncbi:hypothetical protein DSO57_1032211 [Entomophthora muscae]|uniref:Uncharacterized protein n=1 Tax=Entomophthora muscae TaxID=34485 RepID=A0ACC2T0M6_9FUNG|nr:hypothetical protein DSO57_1032211 [Entomophthora muscae]
MLMGLSSSPTLRRSSTLQRSSLVTTEIGLALIQYATREFSRTMISLSVHSYLSLEKTRSFPLPLLLGLQVSYKVLFHLANTTRNLNRLLQEFLVHHNLLKELEPLIREVVKWNRKYLSLKTQLPSNLSPTAWLFIPDKALLSSTPPPGTEPKSGGGFCLTAEEVLRRRNNNLCSYCGSKDQFLPACPLSKRPPFANKTSTLALLSLNNTSDSPTVLVTIHGPLGKIKVLALLDTGADANFIEEKLAKTTWSPCFWIF